MARLEAKAPAIPVTASSRLPDWLNSAIVCPGILPGFVKILAISVVPSSLDPLATMVCRENESGGEMFLRDVVTRWGE
jgi:hypothetical protein